MERGKDAQEFMLVNSLQSRPKDNCFHFTLWAIDRRILALKNNLVKALTA